MTSHSNIEQPSPILVFLAKDAADVVISQLMKHGYGAVAVYTIPELFDALRSGSYALAVTTRPGIAMVRNIKLIPVLNLEVFFFEVGSEGGNGGALKQFDGKAFLDRIRILNVPRSSRESAYCETPVPGSHRRLGGRLVWTWWDTVKSCLNNRTPASVKK